jgi:hypothetical protein
MNRRMTDRSPSPYARIAALCLIALVSCFVATCSQAATVKMSRAPIVELHDDVLVQTGWLTYEKHEDQVVLYCVKETDITLTCQVFVVTDDGNAIVLVKGVVASEAKT